MVGRWISFWEYLVSEAFAVSFREGRSNGKIRFIDPSNLTINTPWDLWGRESIILPSSFRSTKTQGRRCKSCSQLSCWNSQIQRTRSRNPGSAWWLGTQKPETRVGRTGGCVDFLLCLMMEVFRCLVCFSWWKGPGNKRNVWNCHQWSPLTNHTNPAGNPEVRPQSFDCCRFPMSNWIHPCNWILET